MKDGHGYNVGVLDITRTINGDTGLGKLCIMGSVRLPDPSGSRYGCWMSNREFYGLDLLWWVENAKKDALGDKRRKHYCRTCGAYQGNDYQSLLLDGAEAIALFDAYGREVKRAKEEVSA